MALPVFFPSAEIATALPRGESLTVRALCDRAGISCRVSGPAGARRVRLGDAPALRAVRLPGPMGEVWLGVPGHRPGGSRARALLALGLLAYGVFDYAARESLRGLPASRPSPGPGRPRTGLALSAAERQRRFRLRRGGAKQIRRGRSRASTP